MIYALVRGWLAGMAAVFIEILLSATFLASNVSSRFFLGQTEDTAFLPIAVVALIEEGMKFFVLRGISSETVPFFRNAAFKGLLVGAGFALFEVGIKILFRGEAEALPLPGALSGSVLHIITGGILGIAWLLSKEKRGSFVFFGLFFLAALLHILYNLLLSPILFEYFS